MHKLKQVLFVVATLLRLTPKEPAGNYYWLGDR